MTPSGAFNVARAVTSSALGVFLFLAAPIYGSPFGGCASFGWFELNPGCGRWPEALRGFLFVLPMSLLAPVRWMLPVVANVLLLFIAVLGGFYAIRTGEHHSLSEKAVLDIVSDFRGGHSVLVGGLLAALPWAFFRFRGKALQGSVA